MFSVSLRCDGPKAVFLQDMKPYMKPYFECPVIGFIINLYYYPLSLFFFFLNLKFFEREHTIKPVLK